MNHPSWIILTVVLYLMFSHLKGVQMRKDRKIVERVTMLALANGWEGYRISITLHCRATPYPSPIYSWWPAPRHNWWGYISMGDSLLLPMEKPLTSSPLLDNLITRAWGLSKILKRPEMCPSAISLILRQALLKNHIRNGEKIVEHSTGVI